MAFGAGKSRLVQDVGRSEEHVAGAGKGVEQVDLTDDASAGGDGFDEKEEPADHTTAKDKPLLDEVKVFSRAKGKNPGGSKYWQCNHCKKSFSSSYTRIRVHFFGAGPGEKAHIQRCSAVASDRSLYKKLWDKDQQAEKKGVSNSVLTKTNKPLKDAFGVMERDGVDLKIIRFMTGNGIPFKVMRSPLYHDMVYAINNAPKGYKAPSYEKARTTLLDACKTNVENDLAPVKETWYTHGVSIVSDGWTTRRNEPPINVIASNSRSSMFLYAEDFSGTEKTGEVIAQFLLKAIEEIGPSNVLQVVTDNAANCKSAGNIIEKVHKHIFWSPCVVHTLNLVFKDLSNELPWMHNTYKAGKTIVKFVLNHSHCLALFRANSKLDLLKVAKTRFASHYILLKRLGDCREALATTVVTRQWKDWIKVGDQQAKTAADLIVKTINDDHFWDEVDNILAITKPLYMLIKFSDGEGPKVDEIYERMDSMLGEIRDVMRKQDNPHREDFSKVNEIVLNRWGKMNWTFHCLAFALCPKYYDQQYLATATPGGIPRKPPNQAKEVMRAVLESFAKIAEDAVEQKLLREQFNHFVQKKDMFALPAVQLDAVTMGAIDWWFNYGAETLDLAEVAKKVLSQPISSSSAERNWSTYSYIHNVKRNRLNAKTTDKLVYIHSNLRLQSRFCESYKEGPHCKWDIDPDNTILEESSLKLEELRWKHLEDDFVDDRTTATVNDGAPPSKIQKIRK